MNPQCGLLNRQPCAMWTFIRKGARSQEASDERAGLTSTWPNCRTAAEQSRLTRAPKRADTRCELQRSSRRRLWLDSILRTFPSSDLNCSWRGRKTSMPDRQTEPDRHINRQTDWYLEYIVDVANVHLFVSASDSRVIQSQYWRVGNCTDSVWGSFQSWRS